RGRHTPAPLFTYGNLTQVGSTMGRRTYRAGALDKGKPAGRRGRNATGPILINGDEKASRAAWRTSPVVMAGGAQGREDGLTYPLPSQGDPIHHAAEAHGAAPQREREGLHPHRAHGRRSDH